MKPFLLALDYPELRAWYEARGELAPAPGVLPETGFVEPGVAAGFLYLTDSELALLDGYVTNPAAPLRARNAAIDAITAELLGTAKEAGAKHVVGLCASAGVERRARKFGLARVGTYTMVGGRV